MLTLLTGVAYPLVVTGVAQALFPAQAAGSLIVRDGKPVGSALIGQNFSDPKHFWGRPSATGPMPYNGGCVQRLQPGPAEPGLDRRGEGPHRSAARGRPRQHGSRCRWTWSRRRPAGWTRTSASPRRATRWPAWRRRAACRSDKVQRLVEQHIAPPLWGFLGEPRVNVLRLNLALDAH